MLSRSLMQTRWIVLGGIVVLALIVGGSCAHTYNKLIGLDQDVQAAWADVENNYQSRMDQIPNAVKIVRAAAEHEEKVFTEVAEARSQAAKITMSASDLTNPAKLKAFQDAQDKLGSSLSRLMAVAEQYPTLTATQQYAELNVQLSGIDNRVRVARMRFNETARDFNTARNSFPTNLLAGMFGGKFADKAYFAAQAGANEVPSVNL
jgi:LemA protein